MMGIVMGVILGVLVCRMVYIVGNLMYYVLLIHNRDILLVWYMYVLCVLVVDNSNI